MRNLITEADFQNTIVEYAHLKGWLVAHFRGVRVQRKDGSVYYQTPVQADGVGFPDLVLTRDNDIYFVEVKTERGKLSPDQQMWLTALGKNQAVRCFVWKPSDWETIEEELK